jgi:hypothetical protein
MKKILIILNLVILISCSKTDDKIVGKWERINDSNKGMVIEVTKEKDKYVGRIVNVTKENNTLRFAVDDVKWKEIELIDANKFKYQDLYKSIENGKILDVGYLEGYIEFNEKRLIIKHTKRDMTGLRQEWIKIN